MITPAFPLTAPGRVLPKLALDFTTAALDPRVTFTRAANTATVINSSGVIVAANADVPRFDYNPTTLVCRGLLIESARSNELLNSLIDGTSLATQTVTVTAAARTLSFYGNGSVVLSGAHSATVNGVGVYPTRTTLTFTPTAGSLTLTVTGTVQFAQLELGTFATSFIPTAGAAVTRNADTAVMTGTNFSDWYNLTEGTFVAKASQLEPGISSGNLYTVSNGDAPDPRINVGRINATTIRARVFIIASAQADLDRPLTQQITHALAYKQNNFAACVNGGAIIADSTGNVPTTVNKLHLGKYPSAAADWNGHLQAIQYWPLRLSNAGLQTASSTAGYQSIIHPVLQDTII